MDLLLAALLGVSALIHLLPLPGALGAVQLEKLYGAPIEDPTVLLAMRHRAVLFGVLGGLLVAAIFLPELRWAAVAATLVSDLAFAVLALRAQGTHPKMKRVLVADVVSITCLVLVCGALLA